MNNSIQFAKVGGSLQPIVNTADDFFNLITLPPTYWSVTSIDVGAVSMDPAFLAFMDSDNNGRIRIDEVKNALSWLKTCLRHYKNLEAGSDILFFDDLDPESPEAMEILASARLAILNTRIDKSTQISLTDICDRRKLIAAGLTNGDGVIPPAMLSDPEQAAIGMLIMKKFSKAVDASGSEGFNADGLKKFVDAVVPYLGWYDSIEDAEKLPFGTDTASRYAVFRKVEQAFDQYFDLCSAIRLFNFNPGAANQNDPMNTEETLVRLQKAPVAVPQPDHILSRSGDLNPLWRNQIEEFFEQILPGQDSLPETEWIILKKKFVPYTEWLKNKTTDLFDDVDTQLLKNSLKHKIPDQLSQLIDEDLSHTEEIKAFDKVQKLILYQKNMKEFLNNYVNLGCLFDPQNNSVLISGRLIMDGRYFCLATKVYSIAEHKKIALRSNICILYVEISTGAQNALQKMQLAVAVTSGNMYNLFPGKNGVFITKNGVVWDAKVIDFVQQPVSITEALQMPFIRFGEFIEKQTGKFFSSRTKEFEQGVDKTMAQAQKFNPQTDAAKLKQSPQNINGSMMLMGGGIGLAAIGSSAAFIAQVLKNISFWNVLTVFLVIMLIFGGPIIVYSLAKLYRRNIAVFLEASGLALNKSMRLSRKMGRIFTFKPSIPLSQISRNLDVVQTFFVLQLKMQQAVNSTRQRKRWQWVICILTVLLLGLAAGILTGYFLFGIPGLKIPTFFSVFH